MNNDCLARIYLCCTWVKVSFNGKFYSVHNLGSKQGYVSQLYIRTLKSENHGHNSLDLICYPFVYVCNVPYTQLGHLYTSQVLLEN